MLPKSARLPESKFAHKSLIRSIMSSYCSKHSIADRLKIFRRFFDMDSISCFYIKYKITVQCKSNSIGFHLVTIYSIPDFIATTDFLKYIRSNISPVKNEIVTEIRQYIESESPINVSIAIG